jgi:hypothetical protein
MPCTFCNTKPISDVTLDVRHTSRCQTYVRCQMLFQMSDLCQMLFQMSDLCHMSYVIMDSLHNKHCLSVPMYCSIYYLCTSPRQQATKNYLYQLCVVSMIYLQVYRNVLMNVLMCVLIAIQAIKSRYA